MRHHICVIHLLSEKHPSPRSELSSCCVCHVNEWGASWLICQNPSNVFLEGVWLVLDPMAGVGNSIQLRNYFWQSGWSGGRNIIYKANWLQLSPQRGCSLQTIISIIDCWIPPLPFGWPKETTCCRPLPLEVWLWWGDCALEPSLSQKLTQVSAIAGISDMAGTGAGRGGCWRGPPGPVPSQAGEEKSSQEGGGGGGAGVAAAAPKDPALFRWRLCPIFCPGYLGCSTSVVSEPTLQSQLGLSGQYHTPHIHTCILKQ